MVIPKAERENQHLLNFLQRAHPFLENEYLINTLKSSILYLVQPIWL
jgi:hypothetical protein